MGLKKGFWNLIWIILISLVLIFITAPNACSLQIMKIISSPYANAGENIVFLVYHDMAEANVYICSTPNVSLWGCIDKFYSESRYVNENPAILEYKTKSSDNTTSRYYAYVCNSSECSPPYEGFFLVNHIPIVTNIILNSTGNFTENDNLICEASVYDFDNDNVSLYYEWYYTRNNQLNKALTSPFEKYLSNSFTQPGDIWYCAAIANDGKANSSEQLSSPKKINSVYKGPTVNSIKLFEGETETDVVNLQKDIRIKVDYSGIKPITAYFCDTPVIFDSGCDTPPLAEQVYTSNDYIEQVIRSNNLVGKSVIYLKLCDKNWDCSAIWQKAYRINNPPIIYSLQITSTENFSVNGNLICEAEVSDADNDSVNLAYKWYYKNEDNFVLSPYENGKILSHSSLWNNSDWLCEVSASDGYSIVSKNSSAVHVGIPTPAGVLTPAITALADNSGVAINTGLSLIITVNYTASSGVRAYVCSSPHILPSGCFDSEYAKANTSNSSQITLQFNISESFPEKLEYYVRIFDETNTGSNIEKKSVIINYRPTSVVFLGNYSSSDTAICNYTYYGMNTMLDDFEEGSLINWYFADNNTLITNKTVLDIMSAGLKKGERVKCSVKASDVFGHSDLKERFSNTITIQNSKPYVYVNITPNEPRDNDSIVCNFSAFDNDNDNLTASMLWIKNNEIMDTLTTNTVENIRTLVNDTWTCVVEVSDGELNYSSNYSVTIMPDDLQNNNTTNQTTNESDKTAEYSSGGGGASFLVMAGASNTSNNTINNTIQKINEEETSESSSKITSENSDSDSEQYISPAKESTYTLSAVTGSVIDSSNNMKNYSKINLQASILVIICVIYFLYFYITAQEKNI